MRRGGYHHPSPHAVLLTHQWLVAPSPCGVALATIHLHPAAGQLSGISCRQSSAPPHPMDPLDADEMRVAQTVLRTNGLLSDGRRITLLDVNEPSKADVLSGRAVSRAAFAVIYDATRNATGEAIVDVSTRRLRS